MDDKKNIKLTREVTDPIYEKHWEPGFEWMSEEGFNKAVNVIAKDLKEAGMEASNCFLSEVGRNLALTKLLDEAVGLLKGVFHDSECWESCCDDKEWEEEQKNHPDTYGAREKITNLLTHIEAIK